MSLYTLHEYIKIDRWSEFKSVYHEVKAIAETVRAEYRRVNKPFTSSILVHEIKAITTPISRIFNYRYRDEKLRKLLTSAVQALHRLALEIESFYQGNRIYFVSNILDKTASMIVSITKFSPQR